MWSEEGGSLKFESSPIFPFSLVFFPPKGSFLPLLLLPFHVCRMESSNSFSPYIFFFFSPIAVREENCLVFFRVCQGGNRLPCLDKLFFLPPPIVRSRGKTWKFERAFRRRHQYSECIFCILYSPRLKNIIRSISFAKKYVKCWSEMWKVGPRFLDLLLLIFWRIEGELENTLLTQYPTSPWAKPPVEKGKPRKWTKKVRKRSGEGKDGLELKGTSILFFQQHGR